MKFPGAHTGEQARYGFNRYSQRKYHLCLKKAKSNLGALLKSLILQYCDSNI